VNRLKIKQRLVEFRRGIGPAIKESRFMISRMRKSPLSIVGIAVLLFFSAIAIFAPLLAPPTGFDPYIIPRDGFTQEPQPPSEEHIFGTTQGQFDIYYGCIWGTRSAFRVGFLVVGLSLMLGIMVGVVSGYYGGVTDELMMRFTDIIYAFPGLILCMALVVALPVILYFHIGPLILIIAGFIGCFIGVSISPERSWLRLALVLLGLGLIAIAIVTFIFPSQMYLTLGPKMQFHFNPLDKVLLALTVVGWPTYSRVMRGEILRVKQEDYVEAAKAIGCSDARVIFRHILPNSIYPLLIMASLNIGAIVLTAAALSFLGLGAPPGYADWGQMISFSRNWIAVNGNYYYFTWLIPGLFIFVFVLGWNLLGDAFRDISDPTLRRR
jgi:peptide/nickel transport system permease protein